MATRFTHPAVITPATLALALAIATSAAAQDISLANANAADLTWKGPQPGVAAGRSMDLGPVSKDDRRDLVVGAPGNGSVAGAVYLIFGGPLRTGDRLLTTADAVITSSEPGNLFGASTAVGNILSTESATLFRNLAVGAPGAQGGRGAVYVFTAGFASGAATTAASAVYTILGAPGDQLGAALATADMDNDGFREIIIGAPGTSRVYIVKGGAALSGTLNLATTAPAATITAAGIGRVLTAGDVTNDNIADLVVGSPSQNVVFLYPGTTGAVPSVPTASFAGIDAGDELGSSVRIGDIDGDGRRDLVIGAAGGDGPNNDRANAGELYLYFGPVAAGPRSAGAANVIFFGAAAGMRSGVGTTAGDINRDTPNDLVVFSPGGAGGGGQLEIYYGRTRTRMGTVQPDGRRFVDFGLAGQVNRRIIGDPATGAITSAQVFEVTGEGARDIIVGIDTAEAGAGKLYFTISPKMRVTPTTMQLFVSENGSVTNPNPVTVENKSTVFIGWETTANVPWLSTSPAAGSADATHPAAFFVVGSAAGLAPGSYTGRVTASSTSEDLLMSIPIDVTMTVTGARMALDAPVHGTEVNKAFTVSGWAIDQSAATGTGITEVQIWAYPNPGSGQTGTMLGTATLGGSRPDIGQAFGARFTPSGFSFTSNTLAVGTTYQIAAFAKSSVLNQFVISRTAVVTVVSGTPNPTPVPTPNPDPGPTPVPNPPTAPPPNPNTPGPDTRVSLSRSALFIGAIAGTNGLRSTAQQVFVGFSNGASTWTVSSDASWLDVAPASGAGAGSFNVTARPGTYSNGQILVGTLTVTAPGVPNSPVSVRVTMRVIGAGQNPVGTIDTPANNAAGIAGAIAVTGWAVDDIGIKQVTVWRDPVAGETSSAGNGKIFIGNAVQVDGARPDVDGSVDQPFDYKAGWGYMLLTNMLPGRGNGVYRIHAFADDLEGHSVLLGTKTITCDNAHAVKPFGAIDTPDQGGTVTGTTYTNFGWALTPMPSRIPTDGSTIQVFIDGVPVGRPTYNQARNDIATLFPGMANTSGAVGFFQFDSSRLANGVHTIAWAVTDASGNTEGIGSRFFTVVNGGTSSALTLDTASSVKATAGEGPDVRESTAVGSEAGASASAVAALPGSAIPVYRRDGFDPGASLDLVDTDDGVAVLSTREAGRVAVTLGSPVSDELGGYEGYLVANGRLERLPTGAFLDRRTGSFFWQPGVGFLGAYDLVFVRTENGVKERIPVRLTIGR